MTEHDHLDDDLEILERTLRSGEGPLAGKLLASFAVMCAARAEREERILAETRIRRHARTDELLANVRREHERLRRLVGALGEALARSSPRAGLEALGSLRSVFVITSPRRRRLPSSPVR